ncbi:MAG: hypothetical protein EU532_03905 [Promethearchaeota archaeon]|nr:MAG: hypothetical protein EU532_03905 [Candidatus Lokiarchaeota archaeon]
MSIKLKELSNIERNVANNIRFAFTALLIGDLGHVGSRLVILFAENPTSYYGIFGIGVLLEMIGLIFLFMFYTNAWRLHFNKPNNLSFKALIGIGIFGLIIFAFPQNQWNIEPISYEWLIIRNIPWLIQGVILSGLIIRDARITDDPLMTRIGILIFISFFFYTPVILFASIEPSLGILMIPATFIYMVWQYTSYKRFFKGNK